VGLTLGVPEQLLVALGLALGVLPTISLTRALPRSATSTALSLSRTAMPKGAISLAEVAGPPSPA
jgi:hypothetical protein